jgi:hypothetical protein
LQSMYLRPMSLTLPPKNVPLSELF